MASLQRLSMLAGSTAAALVVVLPAQAEEIRMASVMTVEPTETIAAVVDTEVATTEVADIEIAATGLEMSVLLDNAAAVEPEAVAPVQEKGTETEQVAVQTLDEFLAQATPEPVAAPVATSAEVLAEAAIFEEAAAGTEVAQVTRPLYRGVSPFYIGVGGNIGIIRSGNSAVGDFGFNVISKISLGPRFAIRPSLQFSEDDFNITLPITFNFDPLEVGGVSIFPSLGGGVDFGNNIGLLINGGLDIPISREFTLNSQVNWRVTDDTGLGISLGLGYNFPVYFE